SGSISQVRSRPREPPNKLERDRQTLMHVVQGGDLEFGEVEPFPQHVHADNHSGFTTAKPLQSSPPLSHTKATMEQNRGMFRSNLLVERVELCCALHRGGACHDDVLKAGGDVILRLRHRQSRNLYVSFLGTIIADR